MGTDTDCITVCTFLSWVLGRQGGWAAPHRAPYSHPLGLAQGSQAGPCCVCGAVVLVTDGIKR